MTTIAAMASIEDIGVLLNQKIDPLKASIDNVNAKLDSFSTKQEVKAMIQGILDENKQLKDRIINLECQSRRNNLKFLGIQESNGNEYWNDTENLVRETISSLDIDTDGMNIERAHRLGSKKDGVVRPIIVKFLSFKDRELVLQRCRMNEAPACLPDGIRVVEDFPPEIELRRKKLLPFMHAARNIKARCRMSLDRLIIEGETYTVETISKIPEKYHPETTKHIGDNIVAFWHQESPLSNFHQTQFSAESKTFTSVEQFVNYKKAKHFDDEEAAEDIMKTNDPVAIKKRGKSTNIKNYNSRYWAQVQVDIMKQALVYKFDQNPNLKSFLAETKNKLLVEASPWDKYWGAGLGLHDPKLANVPPGQWPGKNMLGKLLVDLRQKICG